MDFFSKWEIKSLFAFDQCLLSFNLGDNFLLDGIPSIECVG